MSVTDVQQTEHEVRKIIADLESEAVAETDKHRLIALKSIIAVVEGDWGALVNQISWRLKV